ncbi:MAG: hypothetical protein J6K52_04550 [Clostridia bacterium]|nr:hypothetical protein [Clostridia bacterium]
MQENNESKPKKKRFNIFDWYYRDGKIQEQDINVLKNPSIGNFFKLLWKKLNKFISTNLIFVFGNFPVIFILLAIAGFFDSFSPSPLYLAWGPMQGAMSFDENDLSSTVLTGIYGVHGELREVSTATIILFLLGLLLIFTWGFTKVGTTYIYRNIMSGEPVFPMSDFFYVIKRNKKQSIIVGILDAIITALFAYDIYYLFEYYNENSVNPFMLFMTLAMFIIYTFIRPYVYIMIFTFDLKITKIIKNALFFAILGIKRNAMCLLGSILLLIINFGIFYIFPPLGAILPFLITFAILDFMGVYAAYPNIIKYMMDENDARAIVEGCSIDKENDEIDKEEYDEQPSECKVNELEKIQETSESSSTSPIENASNSQTDNENK